MPVVTDPSYAGDWYQTLIDRGIPPNVAYLMASQPQFLEGERTNRAPPWTPTTPYRGQDVDRISPPSGMGPRDNLDLLRRKYWEANYQPGGGAMPGMPWDSDSGGMGQMSPQDTARFRLMMQIMGSRGTGGMQQNPLQSGQQGFMNPQMMALLQYYMAQQAQNQGGLGNYPQGGGGIDLSSLLGTR